MARYASISETVGHTPVVRIDHLLGAEVPADMTPEEHEIFRSTPFGQKAA
jgi:hypothetical protein